MRAIVQRVSSASVWVEDNKVNAIRGGFLVLLGIAANDTEDQALWLAKKIARLRIFEDEKNLMNLSLRDVKGEVLVVSQFTLYGDCSRGRRPSFDRAAAADRARDLYQKCCYFLKQLGVSVKTGKFGAQMKVELINDGPVTLILEKD